MGIFSCHKIARLLAHLPMPQFVWKVTATCALMMCIVVTGCAPDDTAGRPLPEVLRIGVEPDENSEVVLTRYAPLLNYLSETLGVTCQFIPFRSYSEQRVSFLAGEVDLAFFGGAGFVYTNDENGALPIAMRDRDLEFTSYFLVGGNSLVQSLDDLKGTSMAFGSEDSTSGHFMPDFFLEQQGIVPDTFFSELSYSGAHDTTAYWVRDGKVSVGVANSIIIDTMFEDGRLKKEEVRILLETPPYVNYVWTLHPKYSGAAEVAVRDAFLALSRSNAKHEDILDALDAGYFLPASVGDFEDLKTIIDAHSPPVELL